MLKKDGQIKPKSEKNKPTYSSLTSGKKTMSKETKSTKKQKLSQKQATLQTKYPIYLFWAAAFVLFSTDVMAVKEGEMKTGVTYLTGLLDNNIIPLVLLTGTGAGAAVSYMKSSFTPLVIAICTAGGYGFAHKWISSVYTACI